MHTEIIITLVGAIFGSSGFWLLIQKLIEKKSALRQMVFGIGYEHLVSVCHKHIEAGYISLDDLEELNHYLYQPYKQMGGNGTAKLLMEKVEALPNTPPSKYTAPLMGKINPTTEHSAR